MSPEKIPFDPEKFYATVNTIAILEWSLADPKSYQWFLEESILRQGDSVALKKLDHDRLKQFATMRKDKKVMSNPKLLQAATALSYLPNEEITPEMLEPFRKGLMPFEPK